MSSQIKAFNRVFYISAMMAITSPVFADTLQLSISDNSKVGLAVSMEGRLVTGVSYIESDTAVFQLDAFEETRVVGTGTGGFYDDGHSVVLLDSWGQAEVFFSCYKADVAVYQRDDRGSEQLVMAKSVETQYCPQP